MRDWKNWYEIQRDTLTFCTEGVKKMTPELLNLYRDYNAKHVIRESDVNELFQYIDALTADVATLIDLLRGASGQLKILDRHYPHEAVTELLNQIAAALEKK